MYSTVRLQGNTINGTTVGTGFFYSYEGKVFLVTNKHVVQGISDGNFIMTRSQEQDGVLLPWIGNGIQINFSENDFFGHPDTKVDVTVMNVTIIINNAKEQGTPIYCRNIFNLHFANKNQ